MYGYSKFLISVFLLFFLLNVYGQKEKLIIGDVVNSRNDIVAVVIKNLNSNKTTITDSNGSFIINVKRNDTIELRSLQYITKKIIVTDSLFTQGRIKIQLDEKVIELDEVALYSNNLTGNLKYDIANLKLDPMVTAKSLELPNAEVELMTHSEKLLAEADSGKFVELLSKDNNAIITINVDKIINRLSGRTSRMRKRLEKETNLKLRDVLLNTFPAHTLIDELKIPKDKLFLFLDYCEANPDFFKLIEQKKFLDLWEYLKIKRIEYQNLTNQ